MKTIAVFLSMLLIGALTLPALAQRNPAEKKTTVTKKPAAKKSSAKKPVTKSTAIRGAPASTASILKQAGRPFMDTTADGLRMKIWVLTQAQHRKMLGGNTGQLLRGETGTNSSDAGSNDAEAGSITMVVDRTPSASASTDGSKSLVDSMMAGTHHVMVVVKDMPGEKDLPQAGATLVMVSPSEKTSSVDLAPLPGRLGAGISLRERGSYHMTLSVFDNGVTITKEFTYLVK